MPQFITDSLIAGILAAFACGLGALPLAIKGLELQKHTGIAYAAAGGLMFAASVYNLILPGLMLTSTSIHLSDALPVILGILLGAGFLSLADRYLSPERLEHENWKRFGDKTQLLIFIAMSVHSIPEGVAVGVGYSSETVYSKRTTDPSVIMIAPPMGRGSTTIQLHEGALLHRACKVSAKAEPLIAVPQL